MPTYCIRDMHTCKYVMHVVYVECDVLYYACSLNVVSIYFIPKCLDLLLLTAPPIDRPKGSFFYHKCETDTYIVLMDLFIDD